MENLEEVASHLQRFTHFDYVFFVSMLFLCILIGIYFGFVKKKDADAESEYLMGGRKMSVFPISLSLIASFISGITLLGLPTEVYLHGIQYVYVSLGVIFMGFVMSVFYLPVFYGLQITSSYEYLEMRFNRSLRLFGSIMFSIMNVFYLPIVVYVPSLAFNQVTGVDVHITTWFVVFVCVFYTCIGGLKAVVWTDVVQTFSMFTALVIVAIKGTMDLKDGGFGKVMEDAYKTNRLEPPILDVNPLLRHTLWSQLFGGVFYWVQTNAVSQNMIQRYLSLPSFKAGVHAVWIFVTGVIVLMFLCSYNDQMLPLFVMETLGEYPGLSGMFIAGVFSAALSSLSTCLNSMSAVVLEDFVKPFTKQPLTERAINWIMRSVVVVIGVLCIFMVYVVEKMGTVLQLTMSLEAITNGPLFGIFSIGIFLPWLTSESALIGGISGVIVMSWISLNAQWAIASGNMHFEPKELASDQCYYTFTPSNSSIFQGPTEEYHDLYKISYMWYTMFGAVFTIIVAMFCSIFYGFNDAQKIPSNLVTPWLRKFIYRNNEKPQMKSVAIKTKVCHLKQNQRREFAVTISHFSEFDLERFKLKMEEVQQHTQLINGYVTENGESHEKATVDEPPKFEVPKATLKEIVVTDYMRESLDKVAIAEGFKNYDVKVDHGSGVGDGFVGILFKVTIQEIDSDKNLIVVLKSPPDNETRRIQFGSMELFEREVFMYNELLPEFVKFQEEKKISKSMGFFDFPKCYFADYSAERDQSIIIMEDLRENGYKLWDKFTPTNYEHARFLMDALGRFHAISFAMKAQKPEIFNRFKELHDHLTDKMTEPNVAQMMMQNVDRAAGTIDDLDIKKKNRVLKLKEFTTFLGELTSPLKAEPYAVVSHGDCWSNNFMFLYRGGRPVKICLLDWQISRYCSPVLDLLYFFFVCTDAELRAKHYDELLNVYHKSLKDLLDHLGGDTMTQFPLTALLRQLKQFGKFGLTMALFLVPMLMTKNEDLPDMDFMSENMKDPDPVMMEEMMKAFMQQTEAKYRPRMRGLLTDALRFEMEEVQPQTQLINGYVTENGESHEKATVDEPPKFEVPKATLKEIVVTDYMRESLDKVAIAEGFKNYDIKVDHGSGVGDGFVGMLFKVKIQEIDSDKNLIVVLKSPPENVTRRIEFGSMDLFEREVFMYNELLPEFVKFQEEKKISKSMGFFDFPKCYFADYNAEKDQSIIIMEDLREIGFKLWDKFIPTNYEHTKLLMSALGRFHAVSFAMKAQKPEIFERFKQLSDILTKKIVDASFSDMMNQSLDRAIGTIEDFDIKKKNKLIHIRENLANVMIHLTNSAETEPYAVIGHGDCWSNNFMYLYKSGRPVKICLLDWQVSRYCSPVLDLVHFIFSCTDAELRAKHYDELLNIYHRSLKDLLDHLGGDTMTQFPFTAFLRQLRQYGKFGLVMASFMVPMLLVKNEDLPDMDFMSEKMKDPDPALMEDLMKQFLAYTEALYKPRMRALISDASRYGYL
ncbi:CLUMA_CG007678, isoform A [Clunio marinus]|uniref:CLUMA_CG007678, isoform A n=1 Tax=Clunio marinus TaxID=568069 RepID=A0A1J1I1D6_9DIPT|nr:CLUMA_CG007678, isoform A [Clunio marinus]